MGRYIGIGILYQVEIRDNILKEKLLPHFPESLYDYSSYENSRMLRIREDITPSDIADLRSEVMKFCNLPTETEDDYETGKKGVNAEPKLIEIIKKSDWNQLIKLAHEKRYYSFQEDYEERLVPDGGGYFWAGYHFFLIYGSSRKFYPSGGRACHEITILLDRLIQKGLADNRLKSLIHCYITQ